MISGHIPPKNAPFRRDFNAKRAIYQRINPTQHRANKAATRGDDHRRPAVPLRVSRPVPVPVWVADADDLNSITDHQRPTPADVIQRDTPPQRCKTSTQGDSLNASGTTAHLLGCHYIPLRCETLKKRGISARSYANTGGKQEETPRFPHLYNTAFCVNFPHLREETNGGELLGGCPCSSVTHVITPILAIYSR